MLSVLSASPRGWALSSSRAREVVLIQELIAFRQAPKTHEIWKLPHFASLLALPKLAPSASHPAPATRVGWRAFPFLESSRLKI